MPAVVEVIEEDPTGRTGLSIRGGSSSFWRCKDHEVVLSGPAETGKTYTCLLKLDALCRKYRNLQCAIVRRTYKSACASVVRTYTSKILAEGHGVRTFGGEHPDFFEYRTGSRIYVRGLDNPEKLLSTEYDFVYVNQAEEIAEDDWQVLTTRTTGRAGNAPYSQVFADCNPSYPNHWIKRRPSVTLFHTTHKDNPTLWDEENQVWTEQGERTIRILRNLTGVRLARLFKGLWVAAEGAVYEFDPAIHLVPWFAIPPEWVRFRSVDFGYVNPFVCLWWAIDPEGRLYCYREIFHTQRTVNVHAKQINNLSHGERIEVTVCDHDRGDRATLDEYGIANIAADKDIGTGIEAVERRLAPDWKGTGRPGIFFLEGALVETDGELYNAKQPTCTTQEFDVYLRPPPKEGRASKEDPVDLNNHGMDATRYGVKYADWRERVGAAGITSGRGKVTKTEETFGILPGPAGSFRKMPGPSPGRKANRWM